MFEEAHPLYTKIVLYQTCYLCELFKQLAQARANGKDIAAAQRSWFREHDSAIPCEGPQALTLLWCPFPTRRADMHQDSEGAAQARLVEERQTGGATKATSTERCLPYLPPPTYGFVICTEVGWLNHSC